MSVVAIILAAGVGDRLGSEVPKQYLRLGSSTVIRRSIASFLNHPMVDNVIVVIKSEDKALYHASTIGMDILPPVVGGKTRQESVKNALFALQTILPDKVLIHDAARPFISRQMITAIIDKLNTDDAVIPVISIDDTVKKCKDGKIELTIDRSDLWRAQTPQGFQYQNLLNLYRRNDDFTGLTDDSSVLEQFNANVSVIPGSQSNFKITTKADYEMATMVVAAENAGNAFETRVGNGFDVHAFSEKIEDVNIKLCGIDIPCNTRIIAHSDGDVALHAVVDALLGAIGENDIGYHFPPTDDKWKGCDSAVFVRYTCQILKNKNAKINNIDLTVICQKPRISAYRPMMRSSLARICMIDESRINIKATTTEHLGFLGRGEGVAVLASASVTIGGMEV